MRGVLVPQNGGPEVIRLESGLQRPDLKDGCVIVDVAVAGVTYRDIHEREGNPLALIRPAPLVAGMEGAGRVAAVGDHVDHLAVGDRVVWDRAYGSFAESVLVEGRRAVKVPDGMNYQTAVAVHLHGLAADSLNHGSYHTKAGDVLLVQGGAGCVAALAIQIAKLDGATVVATGSTQARRAAAMRNGADDAVAYGDAVAAVQQLTDGAGAHAAFDGIGQKSFGTSLRALRLHGLAILYGGTSGRTPPIDLNSELKGIYVTRMSTNRHTVSRGELVDRVDRIHELVMSDRLKPRIATVLPLKDAALALSLVEQRQVEGKVLIQVASDHE